MAGGIYTGFGYDAPAGASQQSDNSDLTLGARFEVTQDGLYASMVRFYSAGTMPSATRVGAVFSADAFGAVSTLSQANFPVETAAGWQQVDITPVALTSGTDYYVGVFFPGGNYSVVSGVHDADVINGPVTILANSGTTPNSTYAYGATLNPPNTHFSTAWYCVDVGVGDGRPGAQVAGAQSAVNRAGLW